jgi:hypothetical protein
MSHDNNHMAGSERPAAHQYMLTRRACRLSIPMGITFRVTGLFPKPAYVPIPGQYGQTYITGRCPSAETYPRVINTEMVEHGLRRDGSFVITARILSCRCGRDHASRHARAELYNGQQMPFGTIFPVGARLRNYGSYGGSFYATVWQRRSLRGDGNPIR